MRIAKKIKGKVNSEIVSLKNEEIVPQKEAHPRKHRAKYFGELIQMDASVEVWFGNEKTYLHAAIDDCTGRIVGAYFDKQETLKGYYNITAQILENYGIPAKFLLDRITIYILFLLKKKSLFVKKIVDNL